MIVAREPLIRAEIRKELERSPESSAEIVRIVSREISARIAEVRHVLLRMASDGEIALDRDMMLINVK
jgi:hypothetical protein